MFLFCMCSYNLGENVLLWLNAFSTCVRKTEIKRHSDTGLKTFNWHHGKAKVVSSGFMPGFSVDQTLNSQSLGSGDHI